MNGNKLSVKEKIGYGMGDAGCNIIFGAIMLFVNYFYTDIFGLAPALVGVLLLSVPYPQQIWPFSSMAAVDCLPVRAVQRPDVYHAGVDVQ